MKYLTVWLWLSTCGIFFFFYEKTFSGLGTRCVCLRNCSEDAECDFEVLEVTNNEK